MTDRTEIKPFKGLNYYEEADKDIFYGRTREAKELADLVELNPLTLVFGKSGIGKTSLLNAGLFPLLRGKNYLPIRIRLDYSSDGLPLLQQVKTEMARQFDAHHITLIPKSKVESDEEPLIKSFRKVQETLSQKGFLAVEDNESLWQFFRRFDFHLNQGTPSPVPVTPVLVFDQFEEFFTLGKHHPQREELINELYWLIEDQVPPVLEERILNRQESFPYLKEYSTFRVVIGLREDYLPHMDELKQRMPSLHRVLYRVIHLNGIQAREIMDKTGVFTQESIKQDILDQFYPEDIEPGEVTPEKLEVEPALFSLLCDRIYETKVSELTRQAKDEILEDFYRQVLEALPQSETLAQWIEEHLLTDGGFRTPCYLEPQFEMLQAIEVAINNKLLRRLYIDKKEYVEIIHDVLAPVINRRKKQRFEEQKRQKLEKELKQKRKITAIISVIAIIAVLLAVFAFIQKNRADEQKKIADLKYREALCLKLAWEADRIFPTNNTKAIRIAEAAYKTGSPSPPSPVIRALCTYAFAYNNGKFCKIIDNPNAILRSVIFSPDNSQILITSIDNPPKLLDLNGKIIASFQSHTDDVNSAVFSHNGSLILTASKDKTAILWNLRGDIKVELKAHKHWVYTSVFSPDDSLILTASEDKTAKLWTLNGNLLADLKGHTDGVLNAVFSPNGDNILTASKDKTAKVWDIKGNILTELRGHTKTVNNAIFSPDGKYIITASDDGTAKLWNLKGILLEDLNRHTGSVTIAVFSPDGKRIVTTSDDRTAKVWDFNGKCIGDLKGHTDKVTGVVFSPESSRILTASVDCTAKLWDRDGILLADLKRHTGSINSAVFSTNGKLIVTASSDRKLIIWFSPEAILEYLKGNDLPKLTYQEKKELEIDKYDID